MYLKSQCARNHGNQVQSQPHGSEPLSPQNKKEKRKNQRTHKKEEKREALHPRKEREEKAQESHVHPRKPLSPNPTEQKTKNQQTNKPKTKNRRIKEPKHPRPDHQPSPDALCTDPYKNPQPLAMKNQRISHYSLLIRSPPVSPCSELVAHRPSGTHSD